MKHTPGPWTLNSARSTRVDLIDNPKGEAVGEIVWVDVRNPADARLIAAAPALHAALAGAEKALVKVLPNLPPGDVAVFCGEWLAEVRAALTQATETAHVQA